MDGAGSWDALVWRKYDSFTDSGRHGMEEFLLPAEEVLAQRHGVVLLNTNEAGTLSVTNYRLLFVSETTKRIIGLGTIPLAAIDKINEDVKNSALLRQSDKMLSRELLQVYGKDMRIIFYAFQPKLSQDDICKALRSGMKPSRLYDLYAFSSGPYKYKNTNPKLRLMREYYRLFYGMSLDTKRSRADVTSLSLSNSLWRTTKINSSYGLCPTYPSELIVPKSISDEELSQASTFRASQRLPVVTWFDRASGAVIARSSQPNVGLMMSSRNDADERLVGALCTTKDGRESRRKLYIVDARPRANALANGAKGGGSESSSNYSKSEILFLGIHNIHIMRESVNRLRDYVDSFGLVSSDATSSYQRSRGSTWGGAILSSMSAYSSVGGEGGWLLHIQNILVGASWIATCISRESASVLVHCSDGWDRTAQLVSLSSLLLDPYYRTFKGFQALVEKDWLAFGHPFADRMGLPSSSDSGGSSMELSRQASLGNLSSSPLKNYPGQGLTTTPASAVHASNCSPILLQWVDCISQLLRLYPSAFQYSSKFLVDFMDCVLSCRFGNFLCNSEREREQYDIAESCGCLWVYLANLRESGGSFHEHYNPFYDPSRHEGPLLPPPAVLAPTIWPQYHLRWSCPFEVQGSDLDSQWHAISRKYAQSEKAKDVAESKNRDLQQQIESLRSDLTKERHALTLASAAANNACRESAAIKRAVETLGCKINFSGSENASIDPGSKLLGKSVTSYSCRREVGVGSHKDDKGDFSISISAIEDSLVCDTPSNSLCESLCPLRTREGCRWPNAGCAQIGSQFVGLKANIDAFERVKINEEYFGS